MIRSMTGFARCENRNDLGELVWELRSVNHRYLETSVRVPEEFRVLEPVVRERVARQLGRGKVDCTLRYKPQTPASIDLQINGRLLESLLQVAHQLEMRVPGLRKPGLMDLLRWPGLLETPETDFTPLQMLATELLERALTQLVDAREAEGVRIAEIIDQRCSALREEVAHARTRVPEVVAALRARMLGRMQNAGLEPEPARLEQELVLWAQRLDVAEEMDRLEAHLEEVVACLGREGPVGRRLDFLMQELNREANTLGSKSADAETSAISVELKVLIEQIREQVQNIE
jgi:uncharacterized protein (TIGR00255 family)